MDIIKSFENELERNVIERMLSQFESLDDSLEQKLSKINEEIQKGHPYVYKYQELKSQMNEKDMIIAQQREQIENLKNSLQEN